MLRAAILDKSKENRDIIASAIREYSDKISIVEFYDRYDFEESLDEQASGYDAILLNTTLQKEGDGVRLAKLIRERNRRVMIVFLSDTDKYCAEAFQLFATGYMIFPMDMRYLSNCFNFYMQKSDSERRASVLLKEKGDRYRRIFCRNIKYVESRNREILLHLEDDTEVASYMKLDELQEQIRHKLFLRCHQSYLINLYFVEEMTTAMFSIGGEEIPISRRYQKDAKEQYYNYMFQKM